MRNLITALTLAAALALPAVCAARDYDASDAGLASAPAAYDYATFGHGFEDTAPAWHWSYVYYYDVAADPAPAWHWSYVYYYDVATGALALAPAPVGYTY
jgi:hypothetical protein